MWTDLATGARSCARRMLIAEEPVGDRTSWHLRNGDLSPDRLCGAETTETGPRNAGLPGPAWPESATALTAAERRAVDTRASELLG